MNYLVRPGSLKGALALALAAAFALALHADEPTLEQMDKYAAELSRKDQATLKNLKGRELWVAPDGKPDGKGTQDSPLDLKTALTNAALVKAGDIVWLKGGTYQGPFVKTPQPCGTPEAPLIYRAAPGARVTLSVSAEAGSVLVANGDHTWFWGLEITAAPEAPKVRGDSVKVFGGHGLKLINLVIHDTTDRQGIGGWQVGNDQEFYGCLVYKVGYKSKAYAHGTYTQNTKTFTVKRITDCFFFDTFGFGVHCYGAAPALANYLFEGVMAFGNGLPEGSDKPVVNFLVGCYKNSDNMLARECFTYFPKEGKFKRGADFGYVGMSNENVRLERNVFIGGIPALHMINWKRAIVRDNRIYSPHGLVHLVCPADADLSAYDWDNNTYYAAEVQKPFSSNTNAYRWRPDASSKLYTPEEWRAAYGLDKNSKFQPAPGELWVYKRVNRYEPERVHLIVYNWPRTKEAALDLADVLKPGQKFRVMELHDIFGKPVLEGAYDGKPVALPMAGPYAPEFACYLLIRN